MSDDPSDEILDSLHKERDEWKQRALDAEQQLKVAVTDAVDWMRRGDELDAQLKAALEACKVIANRAETAERRLDALKVHAENTSKDLAELAKENIKSGRTMADLVERAERAEYELARHKEPRCDNDCGQCAECLLGSVQQELDIEVKRSQEAKDALQGRLDDATQACREYVKAEDCLPNRYDTEDYCLSNAVKDLVERAERAEKACAEMRACIESLKDFWEDYPKDAVIALNAMAATAGTGYLSPDEVREKVKPMVDGLDQLDHEACSLLGRDDCEIECLVVRELCKPALDHARKEGWI